jgi:hypothetical protein
MAGVDRSTQRAIVVVVLLVVAASALRGYLPGVERAADRERPQSSPLALIVDVALLTAAVAIIGFAIVVRLRDRTARRPGSAPLPRGSGAMGRPTWRFSLIALGLIVAWLLIVLTLSQLGLPDPLDQPPSSPETTSEPAAAPPPADVNRPPPDEAPDSGTNVVNYLVAPMLILMALVVAGTAIASRRQRGMAVAPVAAGFAEPSVAATDSLARAAEHGLAEIEDLTREPREAIISCYAAMERELTHVPGAAPQDFDTPTEVLARAVGRHALRADSATQLVDLFEEARFSPHVMNEGHRDVAVRVLRLVLAELRSIA